MKNILAFAAFLFAYNAFGQITLTQSSYPASVIGTDSLKKTTYNSTFPSLAPAINGSWDMSVVADSTPIFFAYHIPAITPYLFADSNTYSLGAYSYHGNVESDITSTALIEYGISIPKAAYDLSSLTGGSTDSLIINTQMSLFSLPHILINFPATLHSTWQSSFHYDVNIDLSIAIFSFSHTPGFVRTYCVEFDTIIGWGKMRVRDINNFVSGYQNVLQTRTIKLTVDSFFINGSAASSSTLAALGLTQGQKDTVYQQNYYRAGEVTPLAQVTFNDAAFTQPKKATIHAQRLPANAVPQITKEQEISIYPNPTSGRDLTLTLPATTGLWGYEVVNAIGQNVINGHLKNSLTQNITLPSGTASGLYYLKVSCDGQQIVTKPFTVIR